MVAAPGRLSLYYKFFLLAFLKESIYTQYSMTNNLAENQNQEPEDGSNQEGGETNSRSSLKPRTKHPMETLLKNWSGNAIPRIGDIVEGVVLSKKGTRVFVDLGARGMGIIYGREYYIAQEIIKGLNPSDAVSAKVVDTDNEEGYIELSLKDAGEERRWVDLKKMMLDGEVLELPVLEANRGGLLLEVKGVKGFLPASQLSAKNYPRVDGGDKDKIFQELQKMTGLTIKVKILDLDPAENKLIFTEKGLDQEAIRATLAKYKVGDEVEGEITGVVDFGAFMKFDEMGLEGLIHISEIDWTLIEDPRQVLKVGDKIRAKIIDIQGDKVALSLKALKEDPWLKISEKYNKGDVVKGRVTKINPFGAFVQLDQDFHGLAHVSEFGSETKMREVLRTDQEESFKILLIDPKEHKLSLGLLKKETEEK